MNTSIDSWKKQLVIAEANGVSEDSNGNERKVYKTPIWYRVNHQPISANSDIQMFGANSTQVQKAIIVDIPTSGFHEFDLAYLDGATPVGETVNGANANYIVKKVMVGNLATAVYFEKLTGK